MTEYHKIQTLFFRDLETKNKKLLLGHWSKPEFELLQNVNWVWTEKIDGTNIRIIWNNEKVEIKGKSDKADIPKFLEEKLHSIFTEEKMAAVFNEGQKEICLYGEGYGNRIQSTGKKYISKGVDFILFDIRAGKWWLKREDIANIAIQFGINIVPIVGQGTLLEAIEYVKRGFNSVISEDRSLLAEGIVAKPAIDLLDRSGQRIITKIKHIDFKE